MSIMEKVYEKAQSNLKKIAFPEIDDPRIRKAISIIIRKKIAVPIIVGTKDQIKKNNIKNAQVQIIDDKSINAFVPRLLSLRSKKIFSKTEAAELLKDPMYFSAMLLDACLVDGIVSGACRPTPHTLRPAFEVIKTLAGKKASGFFLMKKRVGKKENVFLFADCAINPEPSAQELAQIGIETAKSAQMIGIKPRVAFLSFSTYGSASHPMVDKVRQAVRIAKELSKEEQIKDCLIDGEFQFDAAIVPDICKSKAPNSKLVGSANVLIFPDLNSGNIAYKIAERLAGYHAVGPIIQGLRLPINDLSRGCSVQDIVDVTAITCVQAQHILAISQQAH